MNKTLLAVAVSCSLAANVNAAEFSTFGEVSRVSYERPSGSLWQQEFAGYATDWDTRGTGFRLGAEYGVVRLSYFDLGTYEIHAEAGGNEDATVACQCRVPGDGTAWYHTMGSIRGFALTVRPTWKNLFMEAGLIRVRQGFKEIKDDGWYENYTMVGYGTMIGAGVEYKRASLGVYRYAATLHFPTPTGTGGATVYALGVKF